VKVRGELLAASKELFNDATSGAIKREKPDGARSAVKRSSDADEGLVDDKTQQIKRHPVEATVATFAMGVIVGGLIGWLISRRQTHVR
jgi:F0F1-type ATP synthase assembly protein I